MGGRRSLRLKLNSAEAEAEALLGLAELGNIRSINMSEIVVYLAMFSTTFDKIFPAPPNKFF